MGRFFSPHKIKKERQLMKKTLSINGNPVDFSYTNEITAIEHTFIKNFLRKMIMTD